MKPTFSAVNGPVRGCCFEKMSIKEPLILLVLCVSAIVGCGKKDTASEQSKVQPTPEQAAQIESEYILPPNNAPARPAATATPQQRKAAAPQVAAQPIQERINGAIHAQLTVQLRMYIEKTGRMPQSFSEFAFRNMDTVPLAPEGMKFVIDPVDRAVTVVKK